VCYAFTFVIPRKMGTPFDFIAQKNAQEAKKAFLDQFTRAKDDIVSYVDNRLGWYKAGEFFGYFYGSFNLSIAVRNGKPTNVPLFAF
jgi:hypothetical protein